MFLVILFRVLLILEFSDEVLLDGPLNLGLGMAHLLMLDIMCADAVVLGGSWSALVRFWYGVSSAPHFHDSDFLFGALASSLFRRAQPD